MTMREQAVDTNSPSLASIGNAAEYVVLLCATILVLTIAVFGGAGIVFGFSMGLAVMFGEVALGVLLIGISFAVFSLLIGLIENTYYEEEETLPEEAAQEQQEGPEREQIGRRREPEEYEV